MSNKHLNKYCRSIRSWLPCSGKLKKQILEEIRSNVSAYLEEAPSADYNALVQRFGSPQQIAATYVDELSTNELLHDLRIRKRIVNIVFTCAALILTIWVGIVTIAMIDNQNSDNSYYEIEIIDEEMEISQ